MTDPFVGNAVGLSSPATRHFAITPDDDTDLAILPRAIFCAASGTAVLRDGGGQDITYNLTIGDVVPFRPSRVLATGTTATLVGWY